MRTADAVLEECLDLLPPSWLWTRDTGSATAQMLYPLADMLATVEGRIDAMLPESDPGEAVALLPDYLRVLGPDPCGNDPTLLDEAGQQAVALQRWTARGGQSIAYFKSIAAAYGKTIEVLTSQPTCCGDECGDVLIVTPEQFVWTVVLDQVDVVLATAGGSECGDYLSEFQPSPIVCPISHAAPAHTTVVFNYTLGS